MKLRRAMAVAAATAVIAPAAFLAAPAAFATDASVTDGSAASTTESAPPPQSPDPSTSAPAPSESSPAPGASQSTGVPTGTPAPSDSVSNSPSGGVSSSPAPTGSPSPSESSSSPAPTPSTTTTAPGDGFGCDMTEEPTVDDKLTTGLSGLPSKIVAGSGYHGFKLNVSNKGDNSYERVDLGVFTSAWDEDTFDDVTPHLTLEYKDPETGAWHDISLDGESATGGYLGYTDVKAKESFAIDLRLSVAKAAPASSGYAISIGLYADENGNCVASQDETFYEFEILAAGSKPGDVPETKPQGGRETLPDTKPAGNTPINPKGTLAATGSSSMLPTIGIVSGITIVAGAGVVFALKRRRGDAAA